MGKYRMKQNLHTHTVFCDGRDTPREMAERAVSLGFDSLGFSGHANTVIRDDCEMLEKTSDYKKEINRLKKEFEGKIRIFLGTELDFYSEGVLDEGPYDYRIMSVHYVKIGEEFIPYDLSADCTRDAINRFYGGDGLKYARDYYRLVAEMPSRIDAEIVGHFDLVTKFCDIAPDLFDTGSQRYRSYALEALHAVREKKEIFEINTGAIGRGYRKMPYPEPFILREMKRLDCKIVVSSDCHNRNFLDCGYDLSLQLLRDAGFSEIYLFDGADFLPEPVI